jgi:hypothetical protein
MGPKVLWLMVLCLGCGDSGARLAVLFPKMYSAYDGVHQFKLPATVGGVAGVRWSASDPSLVDLDPDASGSNVLITTRGAGTVTLTATAGSLSGSADLVIESASAETWDNGNQRYNNGIVPPPRNRDGGMGMGGGGGGGGMGSMVRMMQACANCHNGQQDVEHTPTQTAGYSDSELLQIMTTGTKPAGVPQRVLSAEAFGRIHKWTMTEEEKIGLIVYIRALAPKSQGPVLDFGGRGGGGGGGGRRDGGAP